MCYARIAIIPSNTIRPTPLWHAYLLPSMSLPLASPRMCICECVCIQSNTVFPVHVSNVENVLAFQMQTVMKENRMKEERVSEREN